MYNLTKVISELKKFDVSLCAFYPGCSFTAIENLEAQLNFKLPDDFKQFLGQSNGARILYEEIYGIDTTNDARDLYANYKFETENSENPIPRHFLPIYPNGRGDHYCIDLTSFSNDAKLSTIIFWQHDYHYNNNESPEITSNSFTEFLEDLLNDLNEEYNFDGSDKI